LKDFFYEHIANKKFDMVVIGKREMIDFEMLNTYGEVKELSLGDIFNY